MREGVADLISAVKVRGFCQNNAEWEKTRQTLREFVQVVCIKYVGKDVAEVFKKFQILDRFKRAILRTDDLRSGMRGLIIKNIFELVIYFLEHCAQCSVSAIFYV